MLFVNLGVVRNVVPVIDSGETDDAWALVMPRADKSLRQHLNESGGPLGVADSITALTDIATTLADLDGKIVHRDLKPENVLLLNGHWCLADFGISRYAEATTAPDTQKYSLSPPYAAPERWRSERATIAADVYALGVMAYEMVSGSLPFSGSDMHDFREQHLHSDPGDLSLVAAPLAALIEECLYKSPEARPSPSNVLARLGKIAQSTPSEGLARLQEANRAEAVRRGESDRRESQFRTEEERRAALFDAASRSLARISDSLREAIEGAAPTAHFSSSRGRGWSARLSQAALEFGTVARTDPSPWGNWTPPAFDVIAHTAIEIRIPSNRYEYEGRVHSLWFCDAQEAGRYKWFETAFMVSPFIPKRGRQNPFAMNPGEESAKAVWNGISEWQVAWPFSPLAVGDLDEFINRWSGWFADAAQGRLNHPSSMPERSPQGSWRRN
jgi:serine/threonine-protein kinase